MQKSGMIKINVSIHDSGCLPTLLAREILKVQKMISVTDWTDKISARFYAEQYLAQLTACAKAVDLSHGR
jgi:hypothetical protein